MRCLPGVHVVALEPALFLRFRQYDPEILKDVSLVFGS